MPETSIEQQCVGSCESLLGAVPANAGSDAKSENNVFFISFVSACVKMPQAVFNVFTVRKLFEVVKFLNYLFLCKFCCSLACTALYLLFFYAVFLDIGTVYPYTT